MATIPAWINDGSLIDDPFGHGERAVQWLRKLRHPKNTTPGNPFELDDWQERIIRKLYGPRHTVADPARGIKVGDRIYRQSLFLFPRGSRKTALCAAIALLELRGPDRLPGGLVMSAAGTAEQARELFNEAALIVQHDPRLRRHMRIKATNASITYPTSSTTYKAVSSNGLGQHGKTPNVIIADELHVWKGTAGRELWDALDSSLSKISNTLMIVATTAGRGQDNIAWKYVEKAMKVQSGEIDDPSFLPVIFAADKDDDWRDPALWKLVCPGMKSGYPDLASYHVKAANADQSPHLRDQFLQYGLNVWLDKSTSPFVEMDIYDEGGEPLDAGLIERLAEAPCYVGVDLSIANDLTSIVAAWRHPDDDEAFIVRPWFFCPEDAISVRSDRDGVPYAGWAKAGLIIPTPGPVVDQKRLAEFLRELCATFRVEDIAYDPARATLLMSALADEGLPVIRFDQSWKLMAPAVDTLERAIIGRKFRHGGHPVLRWNFGNIATVRDRNDNVTFHKSKSTDRIDGAVATAMAVSRASVTAPFNPYADPSFDASALVF